MLWHNRIWLCEPHAHFTSYLYRHLADTHKQEDQQPQERECAHAHSGSCCNCCCNCNSTSNDGSGSCSNSTTTNWAGTWEWEGGRVHKNKREGGHMRGKAGTRKDGQVHERGAGTWDWEGRQAHEREGGCTRWRGEDGCTRGREGTCAAPAAVIVPVPVGAPGQWWWQWWQQEWQQQGYYVAPIPLPPPPFIIYLVIQYLHKNMYITYFNENKPQVLYNTAWITVWVWVYLWQVMVCAGPGTVWENCTCGIPMFNLNGLKIRTVPEFLSVMHARSLDLTSITKWVMCTNEGPIGMISYNSISNTN